MILWKRINRLMLNDFACVVRNVMQPSEAFFSEFDERKGIVYHEQDSLNTLMANLI